MQLTPPGHPGLFSHASAVTVLAANVSNLHSSLEANGSYRAVTGQWLGDYDLLFPRATSK